VDEPVETQAADLCAEELDGLRVVEKILIGATASDLPQDIQVAERGRRRSRFSRERW
jgi:hypothetical protein